MVNDNELYEMVQNNNWIIFIINGGLGYYEYHDLLSKLHSITLNSLVLVDDVLMIKESDGSILNMRRHKPYQNIIYALTFIYTLMNCDNLNTLKDYGFSPSGGNMFSQHFYNNIYQQFLFYKLHGNKIF